MGGLFFIRRACCEVEPVLGVGCSEICGCEVENKPYKKSEVQRNEINYAYVRWRLWAVVGVGACLGFTPNATPLGVPAK